ncbi:tape measure protein [Lactococcus sp. DD01]|uniref:tape measure protein n=1 Tax=Lactococcus sp. DD01 TaxID=1776443 RepID=UPI000776A6F6|nr:tape measure protein [Lactococcus sp. DD01]KXT61477.1 Phage tail length tape-measure protein [Lactococcus sp. DD01]
MESYSVEAILTATDRNFSRAMRNASQAAQKADSAIGKASGGTSKFSTEADKASRSSQTMNVSAMGILKAVGAYKVASAAVGLVKNSVGSAIQRVDTLNNSARTFENMGFGKGETSKAMEALKKSIQGLPTPLDAAVRGLQLLSASTGDIGKSQQIFEALNNGILGFGGSAEQVDNAVRQLSQSFSNGKVDAETWNSLIDAGMGPALNALAKTMNMTTGEMKEGLSKGTVSVEQFQDSLIELNKNGGGGLSSLQKIAQDSTKGISTSIANMKTAVSRGVANVVTGIDKALAKTDLKSISNVINQVGSSMEAGLNKLVEKIPDVINFITQLVGIIKTLAPVIVPVVAGFTTLTGILKAMQIVKTVTGAITAFNAVLMANPIVLVISAIAALVAGFIYLWNTSEGFRNFWIGLWDSITEAVSKAVDWIKKAWDNTVKWFSDTWQSIKDGANGLWDGITGTVQGAVDSVKNAWNSITEFFSNLWNGVTTTSTNTWGTIVSSVTGAWEQVKAVFAGFIEFLNPIFQPMIEFFSGLWEQVKTIFTAAWEVIKTIVMGPVLLIIDLITGNFNQFKEDFAMLWQTLATAIQTIVQTFVNIVVGFYKSFFQTVVNIWNAIVDGVKSLWSSFATWVVATTKAIVDGIVNGWNSFKQGTIDLWNATVQWIKDTWNNFKQWIKTTTDNLVNGVKQGWGNLKQGTVDIFNGLVNGAKQAWQNLKDSVDNVVQSVRDIFDTLRNIDLLDIGRAIIDGFVKGLKSAWEAGMEFISGIGDWIREHKGPIRVDRKLLIPAGNAIMGGLNKGLNNSFKTVQNSVLGMNDFLANAINAGGSVNIGANIRNANNSIGGTIAHEVNLNKGKQPAQINIRLGKQQFKAFVEDISQAQGWETATNNLY